MCTHCNHTNANSSHPVFLLPPPPTLSFSLSPWQFHHRDPGIVGLLTSQNLNRKIFYGIIADGNHTHETVQRIAYKSNPEGEWVHHPIIRIVKVLLHFTPTLCIIQRRCCAGHRRHSRGWAGGGCASVGKVGRRCKVRQSQGSKEKAWLRPASWHMHLSWKVRKLFHDLIFWRPIPSL